jgi:hypothetical protein
VAILSLESTCILTFRKLLAPSDIGKEENIDVYKVILKPRSLLIFKDDAYDYHMHGIDPFASDLDVTSCANYEATSYNYDQVIYLLLIHL